MPKMTIYVPDDLQAEMDEQDAIAFDKINWSALAQEAFRRECALLAQREKIAPKLRDAVNRLRRSKERTDSAAKASGDVAGRKWVAESAEYAELIRLRKYVESVTSRSGARIGDCWKVYEAMNGYDNINFYPGYDKDGCVDFWGRWSDLDPTDEFVEAFVYGALEAWSVIEAEMAL